MNRALIWIIGLLMTVVLPGCRGRSEPVGGPANTSGNPPPKSTAEPSAASNVADKWLGKWIGPEGTYLLLSKDADKYVVLINSLDGPATYEGTSAGDRIEFQRDGKTESIRAGNGHGTGMKWLMDKTNCLIIETGEGFCRD
ncbi:MAG: hypothetical protein WBX19_08030 [Terracidiphilus sp.]